MHQHKIVAQILLILSILNSALAAPVVGVREIPGARGAVAVRVPAEGVVAVLEKRLLENQQESSAGPSSEHPEPQSTRPPEPTETYHDSSSELGPSEPTQTEQVYHDASSEELKPPEATQTEPVYHDASSEELGPPEATQTEQVYHDASPEQVHHDASSEELNSPETWKQKILTPETIKAAKYVGAAALLATAYLGLLLPLTDNDSKDKES